MPPRRATLPLLAALALLGGPASAALAQPAGGDPGAPVPGAPAAGAPDAPAATTGPAPGVTAPAAPAATTGRAPGATAPAATAGPAPGATAPAVVTPDQRPLTATRLQTRRLQRALGVAADGRIGARTRAALRRYERREALTPDGRPDPEVLGRLGIDLTRAQVALLTTPAVLAAAAAAGPAAAQGAVAAARGQLGTPYVRAGAAPGGFDCSGLTSWAFAQVGVTLPHSSFAQAELGTPVDPAQLQPGDLVLFDTAGPGPSDVGIATSPATVVSATTKGVREHPVADAYWGAHLVGARRLG